MSAPQPETESRFIDVGRPINEIIKDLSKPIPQKYLKTRNQGGNTLTYIPWYNATILLDYYAPGWDYHVEVMHVADKVCVIATITILAAEGRVTRQATGIEEDDAKGYGDPFSNASSMALRRAAAHFGLGRYLYQK
jgi:hypothetical protein